MTASRIMRLRRTEMTPDWIAAGVAIIAAPTTRRIIVREMIPTIRG